MPADDSPSQYVQAMEKAASAEGEERLALLQEAARFADLANDLEAGLQARDEIIDAATWTGHYEIALIAFNWMLGQFDRNRDDLAYYEHSLLWHYKWILEHLHQHPQITRAQIEVTFADMERRYEQAGYSPRAVHKLRAMTALDSGDPDTAARQERLWQQAPADFSGDCEACEINSHATYLLLAGDTTAAFKRATPIFKGKLRCGEVPGITDSDFLVPLLRANKLEQAVQSQKRSYHQMRGSRKFLAQLAQHLLFYALTGQATKAVRLFEARLPWALETRNAHNRFHFLRAGIILLERLARAGKATVRLNLPRTFPGYKEDGRYATADVVDSLTRLADDAAQAFDRRNENAHYATQLREREALVKMESVELPVDSKSTK